MDGYRALSFYPFADADPVQQDLVLNGSYWLLDTNRKHLGTGDFLHVSQDFDARVMLPGNNTDHNSAEDILLVAEASGKTGPQLTIPTNTLGSSTSFTVELWFAFETMTTQNLTLVGTLDKSWYKGFGIAGVLNTTGAALACVMDAKTDVNTNTQCGFSTSTCATFLTSVRVWHHFACSRTGNASGRLMYDGISMLKAEAVTYSTSIGSQFSSGVLVLGAKETGSSKSAGFTGYIRELRMWNRWLSDREVVDMMHTYGIKG